MFNRKRMIEEMYRTKVSTLEDEVSNLKYELAQTKRILKYSKKSKDTFYLDDGSVTPILYLYIDREEYKIVISELFGETGKMWNCSLKVVEGGTAYFHFKLFDRSGFYGMYVDHTLIIDYKKEKYLYK